MTLVLMVGWAGTTVLALVGLLGLRRTWERDRLREARLSRLEDGFAALGAHDRLAEVHQLRTRDRRHLRGLVAIPALWVAHLIRPRTAMAVTALALGAGAMGAIHSDGERRSGRVPAYAARVFAADNPPAADDPPMLRVVERPGAGTARNAPSDEAAPPVERDPSADEAGPDPTTTSTALPSTTVAATTSTTVALNLELLGECVADVGVLGIDAELVCR